MRSRQVGVVAVEEEEFALEADRRVAEVQSHQQALWVSVIHP
jgi:hypothetical protein